MLIVILPDGLHHNQHQEVFVVPVWYQADRNLLGVQCFFSQNLVASVGHSEGADEEVSFSLRADSPPSQVFFLGPDKHTATTMVRTMLLKGLASLALLLVMNSKTISSSSSITEVDQEHSLVRRNLAFPANTTSNTTAVTKTRATTPATCRANRLRECAYDCNNDCDCQQGLVCYQRDRSFYKSSNKYFYYGGLRNRIIPGCSNKPKPRNYHTDYCIDPNKFPTKTLWYIGSDGGTSQGQPAFVYPLKECWGDCDKDEDWYVGCALCVLLLSKLVL